MQIKIQDITLKKSVIECKSGPCVVLEKSEALGCPRFKNQLELYNFLNDPELEDHGVAIRSGMSPWSEANPASFNCHSFAVGSLLGMSPQHWIEGVANHDTLLVNPLGVLLKDYFIEIFHGTHDHWKMFRDLSRKDLFEDDIIVFKKIVQSKIQYIHSARVKWIDQKWMALSKLGEHSIVLTPLDHLIKEYRGQFDEILVYRWTGDSP